MAEGRVWTARDWPHVPGAERRRDGLFSGEVSELTCDAVVVGSGAGGGVVAAELAEGGLDVIVLEEGGHHRTESFDTDVGGALKRLYRDGGAQMALGNPPITWAEGRCVGGSTVINGGMSWRTPEKVLDRWHREHWVEGIRAEEMAPWFARVERRISATTQDPWTVGRDNALLREGAERLGWGFKDNVRDQFHCAGTNNCAFGCPTGAKRSTLVTYVPRAARFGARVLADCRVDRVLRRRKLVEGVEGRVVDVDGRTLHRFRVRAPRTVVCAGAVQTPALLLRSGIRSPSGQLGRNLTLHPNAKVVAMFDERVAGWEGVHQAYQVREFEDEGFVMAAVNVPPAVVAMTLPSYGLAMQEVLDQYARTVVGGFLVEDTVSGRVRLVAGQPVATYQLSEQDRERIVRGTGLMCELLFAAGAQRIVLPFDGVPDLRSPDDVRRLHGANIPLSCMEVVTVHIMGTARMGEDPTRHVVDSWGRFHELSGLWVADASLFPGPIGVNPMQTIMALATRVAARILDAGAPREEPRAVEAVGGGA